MRRSLGRRHKLPTRTTWVNYLRCHDDIGWTFDDADAAAVGIEAYGHRMFLNQFYTGQFEGSFARGVPFQENPDTGDMRISGTMASLAGLELAIESDRADWKELAIRRILLLNSSMLSIGGIPLIYLGEEWGVMNDYDFVRDPAKAGDTRWIHRPKMNWEFLTELGDDGSIRNRIFTSLQRLIHLRKTNPAFAGLEMDLLPTDQPGLLAYSRSHDGSRIVVVANFTERATPIDSNRLRTAGLGRFFEDLYTGRTITTAAPLELQPYEFLWLQRA